MSWHRLRLVGVAAALSCVAGCTSKKSGTASKVQAVISDAVHNQGTPGVYWLPPLVPLPAYAGNFDPTRSPVFQIDRVHPTTGLTLQSIATLSMDSGAGDERVRIGRTGALGQFYRAKWHTDRYLLDNQSTYRIRLFLKGTEIAFIDVDLVANRRELRKRERVHRKRSLPKRRLRRNRARALSAAGSVPGRRRV